MDNKTDESVDLKKVGINIRKPIKKVKHGELTRFDGARSAFKSECPECTNGILLVRRKDEPPYNLSPFDVCSLCGQHFEYTDLMELFTPIGALRENE